MAPAAEPHDGPVAKATSRRPVEARHGLWDCFLGYQRTYMPLRNFAQAARRGYASDLDLFITHLSDTVGVTTVEDVKRARLHDYFAELDRRGQAGATRARKLTAVKSFRGYLEDVGLVSASPARSIPRPKQEVHEPRVLTEDEYGSLREACKGHRRDEAIIELFLQTGLRLSEVVNLQVDDVELADDSERGCIGAVRITGKGRKRRTFTVNWKASEALRVYLRGRRLSNGQPVFLSKTGTALTSRAIQRIVKKYMSKAGISRASVHTLRHTFATHIVRKGTNLRVIQEALGHTSLQTTSVYVSLARQLMDRQLQANAL